MELALEVAEKLVEPLRAINNWNEENLQSALNEIIESGGYKKSQVFLPMRALITGAAMTPGGATEMARLFGKDETLRRLSYSIEYLKA